MKLYFSHPGPSHYVNFIKCIIIESRKQSNGAECNTQRFHDKTLQPSKITLKSKDKFTQHFTIWN
jgi:hypothetical protein